jgi:nucleoside-diphosphate-sugar epimerase
MKKILILGGGGFIGGALANRLKKEGNWVRVVDIKKQHPYWENEEFCDEYISADLRDPNLVSQIFLSPTQESEKDKENSFDEVYQLAADMGGAEYLFTGENDANIMHASALINLNAISEAVKKGVKKIFYSSSACVYPEHNQLDSKNPNCKESTVYPAAPDSEYGWEKLFSERLYLAYHRNYNLNIRIARFHNIYGPMGTWNGGKEKVPAAMCRKAIETLECEPIEVWGNGNQTRSFLFIEDCLDAISRFMNHKDFTGPVNIGSEEMVTINELAQLAIDFSKKDIAIKNIQGQDFYRKYGFKCPVGVNGRNSDNTLFQEKMNWSPNTSLTEGLQKTYLWIYKQQNN